MKRTLGRNSMRVRALRSFRFGKTHLELSYSWRDDLTMTIKKQKLAREQRRKTWRWKRVKLAEATRLQSLRSPATK